MRNVLFAAALLLVPSAASALEAVEVRARDHTCNELAQIIRQERAVFVRIGIGGRSFRSPPAQCSLGDKRDTTSLRDKNGALCLLDYACEYDPTSFYNRVPSR
jgi:hypothetical protein